MIPPADVQLTPTEQARVKLTRLAYALVEQHAVTLDELVADVTDGYEGSRRMRREVRRTRLQQTVIPFPTERRR